MSAPYTVVYVEDNRGEVLLLEQAFAQKTVAVVIQVLFDWGETLRYLRVKETARDAPPPDLLLLDQQLPRGEGLTLMHFVFKSDYLKSIPTFLFSSPPLSDQLRSHFKAERIIEKPDTWDGYLLLVDQFLEAMKSFRRTSNKV